MSEDSSKTTEFKKYQNIDNISLAEIEQEILTKWEKEDSFKQSIKQREGNNKPEYVFYDGPPFANGLPHHGHLLTGFVKDIYARYQTLKGHKTERKFGWDTHGLPVEMEVEKELKTSGRKAITEYGIDKFNKSCEVSVMKYANQWQDYVKRQGRWVDFTEGYKTMDINYMESVIWAFKELHKKGLIYQDLRVMPYSWACETPLSNFETRLDNSYRKKESKAVTLLFSLKTNSAELIKTTNKPIKIAVWTTTPWTLPANLALALGNDIDYLLLERNNDAVIIAESRFKTYEKDLLQGMDAVKIIKLKGRDLINLEYEPLFPYLKNNKNYNLDNGFKIYHADFVTTDDGTGIVHIAPGFGEDDQELCKIKQIPTICPVDDAGKFTSEIKDYEGLQVFEANVPIIKKLKEQGSWLKTEQYIHNYPHCWRTDTPLIYKAVSSWYVEVSSFKERMVELNQEINWIPDHIKDGQFGKWLANAKDWSISRNRFWGCPVPIWLSDDPNYPRIDVYGSLDELEQDFGVRPENLHRPYIDELTRPNPDDPTGKSKMVRVTDVLDCWFESGSMPFAQAHYPFSNKNWFEQNFPADFIVEYIAQTRGWFYTLMVLSTAIFDQPPFKNCICHGVILDENSQKLSKRLKNYVSPQEVFSKYGADTMRWYMCKSPVMRGNELNIDQKGEGFKDLLRLEIKPILNSVNFFVLYANADKIKAKLQYQSKNLMDNYILAKAHKAIYNIDTALSSYDTIAAYNEISNFFDVLNNWYIRRNRKRFWQKEISEDKISAYNCFYTVLHNIIIAISPLLPFTSDKIYRILGQQDNISVHLADYPNYNDFTYLNDLVTTMDQVRDICNVSHSIRSKYDIRIRQPLAELKIIGNDFSNIAEYFNLIKDETNVHNISLSDDISKYAEYRLVLNFKILGKKLGPKIKEVSKLAKAGDWQQIAEQKISIAGLILEKDEYEIQLIAKDDLAVMSLNNSNGIVLLDTKLNEKLINEGIARDFVRHIQQLRKDKNYDISAKITIAYFTQTAQINEALLEFNDFIKEQTLADSINKVNENSNDFEQNVEINTNKISISIH